MELSTQLINFQAVDLSVIIAEHEYPASKLIKLFKDQMTFPCFVLNRAGLAFCDPLFGYNERVVGGMDSHSRRGLTSDLWGGQNTHRRAHGYLGFSACD